VGAAGFSTEIQPEVPEGFSSVKRTSLNADIRKICYYLPLRFGSSEYLEIPGELDCAVSFAARRDALS
jgi:hypothetical protein